MISKGGRQSGCKNYDNETLLNIIDAQKPISPAQWRKVAEAYSVASRETFVREGSKVRRHFVEKLCNRMLKPTGNSAAEGKGAIIARAQKIAESIHSAEESRIFGGDGSDGYDDDNYDDENDENDDGNDDVNDGGNDEEDYQNYEPAKKKARFAVAAASPVARSLGNNKTNNCRASPHPSSRMTEATSNLSDVIGQSLANDLKIMLQQQQAQLLQLQQQLCQLQQQQQLMMLTLFQLSSGGVGSVHSGLLQPTAFSSHGTPQYMAASSPPRTASAAQASSYTARTTVARSRPKEHQDEAEI